MSRVSVEINKHSGFCFGVVNAIEKVERELDQTTELYCVGSIVHNAEEVKRLSGKGMKTVSIDELDQIDDGVILFRAHGEPPASYTRVNKNVKLVDATCPVVIKLQQRIKKAFQEINEVNGQLVIYGKKNHAEVIGLNGQTNNNAIVILNDDDIDKIDFNRPIELFAQTTMPLDGLQHWSHLLKSKAKAGFKIHDTICRQMSNRVPELIKFAQSKDLVVFVSGKESSNGKVINNECRKANPIV